MNIRAPSMAIKNFVDEGLFSFPLDMNEPSHVAPSLSGLGLPPNSFFSQSCPKL